MGVFRKRTPTQPVVNAPKDQLDTLVVDMPSAPDPTDTKSLSVVENRNLGRTDSIYFRPWIAMNVARVRAEAAIRTRTRILARFARFLSMPAWA